MVFGTLIQQIRALNFRFRWISVGVFEMCEHHFSVNAT